MNEEIWKGLGLVMLGAYLGGVLAWWLSERFRQREVTIHATSDLAAQLSVAMVNKWLDDKGLVAMPKGKEFKWPTVKR